MRLTIDDVLAFTDERLTVELAERVLRYRRITSDDNLPLVGDEWWLEPGTTADWTSELPSVNDHATAALVREEIRARGVQLWFVYRLAEVMDQPLTAKWYDIFWFINSSPSDQARAAILAVQR